MFKQGDSSSRQKMSGCSFQQILQQNNTVKSLFSANFVKIKSRLLLIFSKCLRIQVKFKGMLRQNIEYFQKKRIYEKLGFSEMNYKNIFLYFPWSVFFIFVKI